MNAPPQVAEESAWMRAMRGGDFEAAWRETDRAEGVRRELERAGRFTWDERYLIWNGAPFTGARVLVRCNHGLGDTLQFIRFVPQLRAIAQSVTVYAQPMLVPLLSGDERFGTVVNGWTDEAPPPLDVEVEIMELAYAFCSVPETLPRDVPYLATEPLRALIRDLPLPRRASELQVGLLWAASDWDPRRSIPLALLEPLRHVRGVRFFSLQQGPPAAERASSPLAVEPLAEHTAAITAAASALLELDLVITVDGMLAHLAGALGRPVWVLLRRDADWRWMTNRADSPWYPTMRLFRQATEEEWSPVVVEVAGELERVSREVPTNGTNWNEWTTAPGGAEGGVPQ